MSSPWLSIPLSDYEGHMGAPGVQQLGVLSEIFRQALDECRPRSVAVLGAAGGNGFEHLAGRPGIDRVIGVDINPAYLDEVATRYGAIVSLELHCTDITTGRVPAPAVALVHAALVFEHTGLGPALECARALVASGGVLSVVLQLPGDEQQVGCTPFASMQRLRDHFSFVDPDALRVDLSRLGLRLATESRHPLASGKAFWHGLFVDQRASPPVTA
jgi:hypothetical protein